ncbi:MAG: secondary thiamine-phosphate synthase enzyme YjbQ [bacterium]
MIELNITTRNQQEMIDITERIIKVIEEKVRSENIEEGIAVLYVPHTTAACIINENADPAVRKDILDFLESYIPRDRKYHHMEGNADAHIKSSILGNSVSLIITKGKVVLGSWQGIFFCEFDGPRNRKIYIQIIH